MGSGALRFLAAALTLAALAAGAQPLPREWHFYGGNPAGTRFSPHHQINTTNVGKLTVAWGYELGPHVGGPFEATPLQVGDTLYLCTSRNVVLALDAETGNLHWQFDPKVTGTQARYGMCRGVSYYKAPPGIATECPERILTNTLDGRLIALDVRTGARCSGFGKDGEVDLWAGMGNVQQRGMYYLTSPPQIARNLAVVGGAVADNLMVGEPPGVIRAFDAVTGKFVWAFDPGRPDQHGEPRMARVTCWGRPARGVLRATTMRSASSTCPWELPPRTTTAHTARRSRRSMEVPSSRSMFRPGLRGGSSRQRTTISGTTTWVHSRYWWIFPLRTER